MSDSSSEISARRHLLVVYSSQTGRTKAMVDAACAGVREFAETVELRVLQGISAGIQDLLWAHGLLIGTPENFGSTSGAVKDFFDRTYYPAEGKTIGLPYALLIAAGNDGTGAQRQLERIATGYRWKAIAEPLIMRPGTEPECLRHCYEVGQTIAAGLAAGLF